jgi:hypothetical protein
MKDPSQDEVWRSFYNFTPPSAKGEIVPIDGVGERDAYNPSFFVDGSERVLAFRCETRDSSIAKPERYHPQIMFARQDAKGGWKVDETLLALDMMEDPFIFSATSGATRRVILGGVRVLLNETLRVNTEFYQGATLEQLVRAPLAAVPMKDIRLLQLPDKRFLFCRHPVDNKGHHGRIALHIIDNLEELEDIQDTEMRLYAVLNGYRADDWVGTNNAYVLKDSKGVNWIGLLGHIAWQGSGKDRHYAATTYRIKLDDLLDDQVHNIQPHVLAIRSSFEDGPYKEISLSDIVFPGSLEHVQGQQYYLWAGLSDTRIGKLLLDNPFRLE